MRAIKNDRGNRPGRAGSMGVALATVLIYEPGS
jgi:hypothetical protein